MALRWKTASRNALADAGVLNVTTLKLYTGTQPASANTAVGGGHTLLATITVAWVAAANGITVISGTPSATAVASGTATWGRFESAGGTLGFDGAVGAEFTLSSASIVSGGTITVTAGQITQPSGEA